MTLYKHFINSILLLLLLYACQPQETNSEVVDTNPKPVELNFDSTLAKSYGADEYGMKQYIMAFLKKGPNRDLSNEEARKLQFKHLEHIQQLGNSGKLVVAGPFLDNDSIRGIYIFNVKTLDEARALTAQDPAIKAGSLEMELRPWYGSAALMESNKTHQRIAKKSVMDQFKD